MTQQLLPWLFFLALTGAILFQTVSASTNLMLAKEFTSQVDLANYAVFEKYDGVRAVWRNGALITRGGHKIHAPDWMIDALPEFDVEGELWLGYNRFDEVSGLARSHDAQNPLWRDVRFVLFDRPNENAVFAQRRRDIEQFVQNQGLSWLMVAKRYPVSSHSDLNETLSFVVAKGGEGLMLNQTDARYQASRTNALLKLKPTFDDEAEVIGYQPGKGKYEGMMGSLIVKNSAGRTFKIGSGFSVIERQEPPEIGQWVTFAYSGFTSTGLPKFPRYLRLYKPE